MTSPTVRRRRSNAVASLAFLAFIVTGIAAAEHQEPGITLMSFAVIVRGLLLAVQAAVIISAIAGIFVAGSWWERRRSTGAAGLFTVRVTGRLQDLVLAHHELEARWHRARASTRERTP